MSDSSGGRLPNSGLRLRPVRTTAIANSAEEDFGRFVDLGIDKLRLGERLGQRPPLDAGPPKSPHLAEVAVGGRVDRLDAEARAEHAVERERRPAALDVAEYRHARLEPGARLDLLLQLDRDPAEAHVPERVRGLVVGDQVAVGPGRTL